jgi:GT2 family glycosyltransferase
MTSAESNVPVAPLLGGAEVPVVIVGFRNPGDVRRCLVALTALVGPPTCAVVVCENGGTSAFNDLTATLSMPDGPCAGEVESLDLPVGDFVRVRRLRLSGGGPVVLLGEAADNLGYAGGVNACIAALEASAEWQGLWVLNPDTMPEPRALAELVAYAERRGKGMVGSRATYTDRPNAVRARGLKWRKLAASVLAIDIFAPADEAPDPDDVERRMDAPPGCSFYVSRECLARIGPMDDSYFLYYEDLDWGLKAKASCGVGYAYESVVPHVGSTTIGAAGRLSDRSKLSVFLDFRNRILFVRRHYPGWLAWTAAMALIHAARYLAAGAGQNFKSAMAGLLSGLRGETGRPEHLSPSVVSPALRI